MNTAHTLHEIAGEVTRCKELASQLLKERGEHLATIRRLKEDNAELKRMLYGTASVPSHEKN